VLALYVQAPFATFRTFTAGWYRPTATFLTPSAAYGLILNLAGIETRLDDGLSPMTVTQFGLPSVQIALGAVAEKLPKQSTHSAASGSGNRIDFPSVQALFQQLHNYPVGPSGKERKADARGNKYNITPVRREFLSDLRACICLRDNPELERMVLEGLSGQASESVTRYGLPFLGDNSFLIDRIEPLEGPPEARWFCRMTHEDQVGIKPHTTRLTIWIDRQEMSRTQSALYAPDEQPSCVIPDAAWTPIDPPQAPPSKGKGTKKGGNS
jgi:CRISPR-associated protein Cas5t